MRSTLSHRLPSRSKRWGIRSAWYGDPSSSVALRQCDHHSCLLGRLAIRYRKTNLFGRNRVPKLHWSEECWLRKKLSDVENQVYPCRVVMRFYDILQRILHLLHPPMPENNDIRHCSEPRTATALSWYFNWVLFLSSMQFGGNFTVV